MAHDPLSVACPDCLQPAGTPCNLPPIYQGPEDSDWGVPSHATRHTRARFAAVRHGTCALCGQLLLQLTHPLDTFHPEGQPVACPVAPDPQTDWNAYAVWVTEGNQPRHPGDEHFIPGPVFPPTPAERAATIPALSDLDARIDQLHGPGAAAALDAAIADGSVFGSG